MLKKICLPILLSFTPLLVIPFVSTQNASHVAPPNINKYVKAYNPAVLLDPNNLISPEFRIPQKMEPRVHFWFDIYSKYTSYDFVIHHRDYPWIVFAVVDSRKYQKNGTAEWFAKRKGEMEADRLRDQFQQALIELANHPTQPKTPREQQVLEKMQNIAGPRHQLLSTAAYSLRIQSGQMDYFVEALQRSSKYMTHMEAIFQQMRLPTELVRIPFVESSFNEKAQSKVGASGVWQLMPQTGRNYLIVNSSIDERNSPLKATRAAAKLLRGYYNELEDWSLAVSSYNHGIGTLQRAIRKTQSRDLSEIVDEHRSPNFRFASQNFYACFLAALHIEKYHQQIFEGLIMTSPLEHQVVRLPREISFNKVIQWSGLSGQQVLDYNLDMKRSWLKFLDLPRGYELYLPLGDYADNLLKRAGYQQASYQE